MDVFWFFGTIFGAEVLPQVPYQQDLEESDYFTNQQT